MFIFKKWLKKYLDKIVLRLKMKLDFFEQKKAMGQLRKKWWRVQDYTFSETQGQSVGPG